MIRFLLGVVANLVLAAVALLIADALLSDVSVQPVGFLIAVVVFALAQSILAPIIMKVAQKYASAWVSFVGLVSTFLALWVATLFSDGIRIAGLGWLLAPLIVWVITALGGWLVNKFAINRYLKKRDTAKLVRKATA